MMETLKRFHINKIFWLLILILFDNILNNCHKNKNNHKIVNFGIINSFTNFSKSSNHLSKISSKSYWENRYRKGGNSGSGSYNHLAKFKASILNSFIIKNHINTIIEFGSGDCNQLSLANYKNYIGYDVSQTAIKICKKKFKNDKTKTFIHLNDNFKNNKKADLSISLEVIFHLIEDTLSRVDDHNGAVRRHKRAIRVLREVLMSGGVEYVYAVAVVGELHDRRRY